jgi:tetratricopeptide (TPR) repeat protein
VWTEVRCPGCDGTGIWGQRNGGRPFTADPSSANPGKGGFERPPSPEFKDAGSYYSRGLNERSENQLDKALADFTRAIELNPTYYHAYRERGETRKRKGDLDGAIADWSKAMGMDAGFVDCEIYTSRGLARQAKGDLDGAMADFSKAIEMDPVKVDFEAHNNRGNLRFSKGDFDGAIADYSKAIEKRSYNNAVLFSNRGKARNSKGDTLGAIADFSKAIEVDSRYAYAYGERGLAKFNKEDYEDALTDCSKSIEIEPKLAPAYFYRSFLRRIKGDGRGALEDISKYIELIPKHINAYFARGCIRYDQHSWAESLVDFRKVLEWKQFDAENANLWIWMIRARQGERDAATKELADYVKARSWGKPDDWFSRKALFLCGQLSEADFFKSSESGEPKPESNRKGDAYFLAGTRQLVDGNKEKAREYFQKCVEVTSKPSNYRFSAQAELIALDKAK